jgi:hypothetical protein
MKYTHCQKKREGNKEWMCYPEDPMAGFLPPFNPDTGYELGWIEFRVRPRSDLPSGAQIANQAFGEFDFMGDRYDHPAPPDGPWINTLDSEDPNSYVLPLPPTVKCPFTVEWTDDNEAGGSGIAEYNVYVSMDGGPFTLWQSTTSTSAIFDGRPCHDYAFYCVATDNVGNRENPPSLPDAFTTTDVRKPDLNVNCNVNLEDLNLLIAQWLRSDCDEVNDWCVGADFNQDNEVNLVDFNILANYWFEIEGQ